MNHKILSLFGLKWNPFSPELPVDALWVTQAVEHFGWRVENLVREGGFALITGDPGTGKSIALRLVAERLSGLRDVTVAVLTRPQSRAADFYRELGHLFGVALAPHNRWMGSRALREKWQAHIEACRQRPVLLVDEAQETHPTVLNELRLLQSADFDSRSLLTIVLCGDGRLPEKFRSEELLPLASRIRVRLQMEYATREQLAECLRHVLAKAGNNKLMTAELQGTLVEHAAGNYRVLMTMANDLLAEGIKREVRQLDEKLYLEVFAAPDQRTTRKPAEKGRSR